MRQPVRAPAIDRASLLFGPRIVEGLTILSVLRSHRTPNDISHMPLIAHFYSIKTGASRKFTEAYCIATLGRQGNTRMVPTGLRQFAYAALQYSSAAVAGAFQSQGGIYAPD